MARNSPVLFRVFLLRDAENENADARAVIHFPFCLGHIGKEAIYIRAMDTSVGLAAREYAALRTLVYDAYDTNLTAMLQEIEDDLCAADIKTNQIERVFHIQKTRHLQENE